MDLEMLLRKVANFNNFTRSRPVESEQDHSTHHHPHRSSVDANTI
jgi:hypothetical protein